MDKKRKIQEIEDKIMNVRSDLMLKSTELYLAKQDFKQNDFEKIDTLVSNVRTLRIELNQLTVEIKKLKCTYFVAYEVQYLDNWTNQIQKEIFHETILLDKDLSIDLPKQNDWMLRDNQVNELLLDILGQLRNRYDEVTLLRVRRL